MDKQEKSPNNGNEGTNSVDCSGLNSENTSFINIKSSLNPLPPPLPGVFIFDPPSQPSISAVVDPNTNLTSKQSVSYNNSNNVTHFSTPAITIPFSKVPYEESGLHQINTDQDLFQSSSINVYPPLLSDQKVLHPTISNDVDSMLPSDTGNIYQPLQPVPVNIFEDHTPIEPKVYQQLQSVSPNQYNLEPVSNQKPKLYQELNPLPVVRSAFQEDSGKSFQNIHCNNSVDRSQKKVNAFQAVAPGYDPPHYTNSKLYQQLSQPLNRDRDTRPKYQSVNKKYTQLIPVTVNDFERNKHFQPNQSKQQNYLGIPGRVATPNPTSSYPLQQPVTQSNFKFQGIESGSKSNSSVTKSSDRVSSNFHVDFQAKNANNDSPQRVYKQDKPKVYLELRNPTLRHPVRSTFSPTAKVPTEEKPNLQNITQAPDSHYHVINVPKFDNNKPVQHQDSEPSMQFEKPAQNIKTKPTEMRLPGPYEFKLPHQNLSNNYKLPKLLGPEDYHSSVVVIKTPEKVKIPAAKKPIGPQRDYGVISIAVKTSPNSVFGSPFKSMAKQQNISLSLPKTPVCYGDPEANYNSNYCKETGNAVVDNDNVLEVNPSDISKTITQSEVPPKKESPDPPFSDNQLLQEKLLKTNMDIGLGVSVGEEPPTKINVRGSKMEQIVYEVQESIKSNNNIDVLYRENNCNIQKQVSDSKPTSDISSPVEEEVFSCNSHHKLVKEEPQLSENINIDCIDKIDSENMSNSSISNDRHGSFTKSKKIKKLEKLSVPVINVQHHKAQIKNDYTIIKCSTDTEFELPQSKKILKHSGSTEGNVLEQNINENVKNVNELCAELNSIIEPPSDVQNSKELKNHETTSDKITLSQDQEIKEPNASEEALITTESYTCVINGIQENDLSSTKTDEEKLHDENINEIHGQNSSICREVVEEDSKLKNVDANMVAIIKTEDQEKCKYKPIEAENMERIEIKEPEKLFTEDTCKLTSDDLKETTSNMLEPDKPNTLTNGFSIVKNFTHGTTETASNIPQGHSSNFMHSTIIKLEPPDNKSNNNEDETEIPKKAKEVKRKYNKRKPTKILKPYKMNKFSVGRNFNYFKPSSFDETNNSEKSAEIKPQTKRKYTTKHTLAVEDDQSITTPKRKYSKRIIKKKKFDLEEDFVKPVKRKYTKRKKIKEKANVDFKATPAKSQNTSQPCVKKEIKLELIDPLEEGLISDDDDDVLFLGFDNPDEEDDTILGFDLNPDMELSEDVEPFNALLVLEADCMTVECDPRSLIQAPSSTTSCSQCNKTFNSHMELVNHMQWHAATISNHSHSYVCSICLRGFALQSQLDKHIKWKHEGGKKHQCSMCPKRFTTSIYLKKHLETIHKEDSEKKVTFHCCGECREKFLTEEELKAHKEISHKKPLFQCDKCLRYFLKLANLQRHKRSHAGEETQAFPCAYCNQKFPSRQALHSHWSVHTDKKIFTCDICNSKFTTSTSLKRHRVLHAGEKLFRCEICQKSFRLMSTLKTHLLIHTGSRIFECKLCGKMFNRRDVLNAHQWIHTGEKKFQCDICFQRFRWRHAVKSHKLIYHTTEKPYACETCGKRFSHPESFKKHAEVHAEKLFYCQICLKAFSRASTLKTHIIIHTDLKPFFCDMCNRGFRSKSHLRNHFLVHTKEKPWLCKFCNKTYKDRNQLRRHKRVVHCKAFYKKVLPDLKETIKTEQNFDTCDEEDKKVDDSQNSSQDFDTFQPSEHFISLPLEKDLPQVQENIVPPSVF